MSWWYFSFVDAESKVFLGGAVVEASEHRQARARALELTKHIEATIEVLAFALKGIPESELPSPPNRNRLLTVEELTHETGPQANFEMRDGKLHEIKEN